MTQQDVDQLRAFLALFYIPGLSLKISHALLGQCGSPQRVLDAETYVLKGWGVKANTAQAIADYSRAPQSQRFSVAIDNSLAWAECHDQHIIHLNHPYYPERLRQIARPPLLLFVKGNPALLREPQLAMVGSRNPSISGKETAFLFARDLSRRGLRITSGLALGIDAASHEGALAAAQPTLAIMATGADRVYPKRHQKLADSILEQGALVSEFPLGTAPRPEYFPQRNRIISGLSLGTLVVEAALKSGSLITARFALEQDREVFAIPGSIHNPAARGCHALIKQGAKLVEQSEDLLEELKAQFQPAASPAPAPAPEKPANAAAESQQQLLENVGYELTPIDLLVERTGLTAAELSAELMRLELGGHIRSVEGGVIRT